MDHLEAMRSLRARLDMAYVGTGFSGWQIQPDRRTVQGELALLLQRLLQRPCRPVGAGRTDAGVHARGQVAHIELHGISEMQRVCRALPRLCPRDIAITNIRLVSPAFDARLSATSRRYCYRLQLRRNLFDPHASYVPWALDRSAMQEACVRLRGVHDFGGFCKAASLKHDNHCRVDLCDLEWSGDIGILHIRADRFLHHMVRNIAAVLVEVGRGRRRPEDLDRILAGGDRRLAAGMAPACGLFLEEVTYPPRLMDPGYLPSGPRPEQRARLDQGRARRHGMKFFIDTADLAAIAEIKSLGMCDGVTTNPSLLAAVGRRDTDQLLREICDLVQGPVSGEVLAADAAGMIEEGERLARISEHMVIKIPATYDGLKAMAALSGKNIAVNATLVFSPSQSLLVAKAGASYCSPFVGRLDDVSHDGMDLIEQIVTIYANYDIDCEVLVASVRHPNHVVEAALMGADIATIPPKVIKQLVQHPLTDRGLAGFLADWQKLQGK